MLPHVALFPGPLQPGSSHPTPDVRTGRLGVLSSLGSVLIWTGAFRFLKSVINRSFAGGSSAGSSARPRCLALDRSASVSFFGRWLASLVGVRLRHGVMALAVPEFPCYGCATVSDERAMTRTSTNPLVILSNPGSIIWSLPVSSNPYSSACWENSL
jgi:hypothetical protein